MASVESIRDVAEKHLCAGCGVCAYLAPESIRMVDDLERGRRPIVANEGAPTDAERDALRACPGRGLAHDPSLPDGILAELTGEWGPVLEVWEGYATDDELRFAASSGGAASALALYGFERGGLHGVLHIGARADVPFLNETVLSTTRAELLERTGSRYAPASPCDGLALVEAAPAPSLFIGKPCDVAAARSAARLRPALADKLAITVGIFCAGAPSTQATLDRARHHGIANPDDITSVRYRGLGWPGNFRVATKDGREAQETYAASWGALQAGRPWRCYVCADHTGEFADIAVGDPWYRAIPDDEPGRSLVLARTPRGAAFLRAAVDAGYLALEHRDAATLIASQPNLRKTRGAIWGRMLATRLLGAAAPRYERMPTFASWMKRLSLREKLSSLAGTVRRTFKKKLRARRPVREWPTR